MVNFTQTEEEDQDENFKINNLKLPDFGCVCKMKWISAHKIEKLFWVIINTNGTIFLTLFEDFGLKILHSRSDLLTNEILTGSILNISIDYMGNGNFKIIIFNDETSLIDYNVNVLLTGDKNTFLQACEVYNVAKMHDLPQQYIYKWIFIPMYGITIFFGRRELLIFSNTTGKLEIYELKKFSLRKNLMQFWTFDKGNITLLANPIDKEHKSTLTILSLVLNGDPAKDNISLSAISKVDIHPSILTSPAELIDVSYIFGAHRQIQILTRTGLYYIVFEKQPKPYFEFSKERVEFYNEYREQMLKKLKHIDTHGPKAGLMGRIFKGKKKFASLIELLKGKIFHILQPVYLLKIYAQWYFLMQCLLNLGFLQIKSNFLIAKDEEFEAKKVTKLEYVPDK